MTEVTRRGLIKSAATIAIFAAANPAFALAAADEAASGAAWDLTDLYPTAEAWDAERQAILKEIPGLTTHKGTLGEGAGQLKAALEAISDLSKRLIRMYVYAGLKADEDLRIALNQEKRQQAIDAYVAFSGAVSWLNPEILKVGKEKIDSFLATDPALAKFRFPLDDTLRLAPHTLGDEGETVLALGGGVLSGPSDIRDQLVASDIPRPEITLSTGKKVRLDDQGYTLHRTAPNREDRKAVFDAFWKSYGAFENSLGASYVASVKGDMFSAQARKYDNALAASLAGPNLPESVYRTLVAEANKGLPTLHRYFALRQKMLGLPDLHYYDIYPSLVSLDRTFTLDQMRATTIAAVTPLGKEYGALLANGTSKKWMDPFPRQGKASGAYMSGSAYDVHPYLLLNLSNKYDGLTTYAHEWGHAIHTLLANGAQPWETAGYSTFTAEIASTANEELLADYMLKNAKTKEEKLFYLGQKMENYRGTFFRQTMFAEFELAVHDMAERGEGISGKTFSKIYLDLLKKYHGPGMTIDPTYAIEWAYISHFYSAFYVFQYATSITAAVYFASQVLAKGKPAAETYLNALKAGGSDYPVEILRKANLDLTTPRPYRALITEFDKALDQAEALLG